MHKRFISALVWRRVGVFLPLEVEVSLGIRKYVVIITSDHRIFSVFKQELGRYASQRWTLRSVEERWRSTRFLVG